MLVSLLKNKKNDNSEALMAHLIPELCFLTGNVCYFILSQVLDHRLMTRCSGQNLLKLDECQSSNLTQEV